MAPCDHSQRSAVGLRTKRRCAGPSFSAAPAAAPPTRRRWPRLAATQAQKYGPVPGTEAAPTAGPRDQARRQSARAGWGNKRGFFRIDWRLGPSKSSPTHPPNTAQHAYRASRLAQKLRGRLDLARVSGNFSRLQMPRKGRAGLAARQAARGKSLGRPWGL